MISFFRRNPRAKLQKAYAAKQREAISLQRKGDMRGFAQASAEAEALLERLNAETAPKEASRSKS